MSNGRPAVFVRDGDTTSLIADRLGVSNAELVRANPHIKSDTQGEIPVFTEFFVGDRIFVPQRVAHQFALRDLPPPGAVPPELAPMIPPGYEKSPQAACKPGDIELSPGVCVPKEKVGPSAQGGCPVGQISVMGRCVPDPKGQKVPSQGQPPATGGGCKEGEIAFGGQCYPDPRKSPGTPPSTPAGSGGCPAGQVAINGQCFPDPSKGIPGASTPSGSPCPDGSTQLYPGLCIPKGANPQAGGDQPPCGPGSQAVVPGLCMPIGSPSGTGQGGCGPGKREILPGVCIPDPSQPGTPGVIAGNTPPSPQECVSNYGSESFPYQDPVSGLWGCAGCSLENEEPRPDGFCHCKPGYVRQNPNDASSPCVPSNGAELPTKVPTTQAERDQLCHVAYGPNSTSVLWQGEWVCNVCRADEAPDEDGYCDCVKGTRRSIEGDSDSACVPIAEEEEESSSSKITTVAAISLGALALLGFGIMLGRSDEGSQPSERDEEDSWRHQNRSELR